MPNRTIYFYLFRQHLNNALWVLFAFCLIVFIGQFAELARRYGGATTWTTSDILIISVYRIPMLMQSVLPHIFIISAALTLFRLSRHLEIATALQSGLSPWQILMPISACGLFFGAVYMILINPLGVQANSEADALRRSLSPTQAEQGATDRSNQLVTQDADGTTIIVANGSSAEGTTLYDASFFRFDNDHNLVYRVETVQAAWSPDGWELSQGGTITQEGVTRPLTEVKILARVSVDMLREKFGDELSITVFQLPGKIAMAQALGLSPHKFRVQFQWLVALPFLLASVTLLSSAIIIRPLLLQHWKGDVLFTILASFTLYVTTTVLGVLASRGLLSPTLSVWIVPVMASLIGVTIILYKGERS